MTPRGRFFLISSAEISRSWRLASAASKAIRSRSDRSRTFFSMGSPSGSRKDIRATLDFSLHNHVLPHITKFPLEDAGKALELMHKGKLSGRAVLLLC